MSTVSVLLVVAVLAVVGYGLTTNLRRVPTGKIGIVHRRFGRNDPRERYSVRIGGGAGPRVAVLRADQFYLLPAFLYRVDYVERTAVPPSTIGVVVALTGTPSSADQTLCAPVDCDSFQDGLTFLANGGQMGRQADVLPGGHYDINPLLFEVVTVDNVGAGRYGLTEADLNEVKVPVGATGVVITLEGAPAGEDDVVGPAVRGHASFQLPSVFLRNGGQRGAQSETLSPGVYRINPWFARVVLIPTRDLILEWTKRGAKPDDNFDVSLDQIRVNVEGHWLRFDMSQTIRIPPKAAPLLVGRFGEVEAGHAHPGVTPSSGRAPVQRFVERVLGRVVENYFHSTAAGQTVLEFMDGRDDVLLDLEERVRQALAAFGVEAIKTTLNEFESETDDLDAFRRSVFEARDRRRRLVEELKNAALQYDIDQIENTSSGERAVATLRAQLELLGRDAVIAKMLLAEAKSMNVPSIISGDVKDLAHLLPIAAVQDIIDRVTRRIDPTAPATSARPLPSGDRPKTVEIVLWEDDEDGP